jgi:hypothetical protein
MSIKQVGDYISVNLRDRMLFNDVRSASRSPEDFAVCAGDLSAQGSGDITVAVLQLTFIRNTDYGCRDRKGACPEYVAIHNQPAPLPQLQSTASQCLSCPLLVLDFLTEYRELK